MKQYLLSIVFFLTLTMTATGQQQFEVTTSNPDTAIFHLDDADYNKQINVRITNVSGEKQSLYWKVLKISTPSDWAHYVCDWNTCYSPGQDECPSDAANNMNPSDTIAIQLHVIDGGTPGIGVYQFLLWSKQDPAVLDTIQLVFIAQEATANIDPSDQIKLRIFPNPTQDYFYLQGQESSIHKIEMFSLLGSQVRSFNAVTESPYYVGDLPRGMYMVYLYDAYGKAVKIFRLRKK